MAIFFQCIYLAYKIISNHNFSLTHLLSAENHLPFYAATTEHLRLSNLQRRVLLDLFEFWSLRRLKDPHMSGAFLILHPTAKHRWAREHIQEKKGAKLILLPGNHLMMTTLIHSWLKVLSLLNTVGTGDSVSNTWILGNMFKS